MRATKDRVYANEAEAHQTTFKWLADVHKEWQAKGGFEAAAKAAGPAKH